MDNWELLYNLEKLNIKTGYIAWLFWLHYLHVKMYWYFILFWISCAFWIGLIRWVGQAFFVKSNIDKYNLKLKILYRVDETPWS